MANEKAETDVQSAIALLGDRIRGVRVRRRLRAADLAARAGVSVGTIRNIESGKGGVSIKALALALDAMGELPRLANLIHLGTDSVGLDKLDQNRGRRVRRTGSESGQT